MDGVIVINKPVGRTSHDLVNFVRRLFDTKKVGHTGTLDPDAGGVLPVCIGRATKAADMLTASDKAYRAQLVFGMTTDTQDASGEILTEQPILFSKEELAKTINDFIGEIEQIPPMFSAIKQNGKKLYELARAGVTVERAVRRIKIFDIKLLNYDSKMQTADIEVFCSKGTYIRTLCEDIGIALGCGAYMNTLERIKSADFKIEDSFTPEQLLKMKEDGTLLDAVVPVDELFSEYEKVFLDDFLTAKAKNGVPIRRRGLCEGKRYRVYSTGGDFLCISKYTLGALKMEKAFWS